MSSGSVCTLPFVRPAATLSLPGCVSRLGHMTSAAAGPDHERKHDGVDDGDPTRDERRLCFYTTVPPTRTSRVNTVKGVGSLRGNT